MHSPDGKKRGGADAASLGGPLVMQVVLREKNMSFEHKRSTRHPQNWLLALITTVFGVPLTIFFGIGIISSDLGFVLFFGFTLGILFLITGTYFIYLIIIPKELIRSVSKEMIVFKSNGVITHQFKKDDIEKIYISMDETPSIKFKMKANKTRRVPSYYHYNIREFHDELLLCGYPVNE